MIYFDEFCHQTTSNLSETAAQNDKKHEIVSNFSKNIRKLEQNVARLDKKLQKEEKKFHKKFDTKLVMIDELDAEIVRLKIKCEEDIENMM